MIAGLGFFKPVLPAVLANRYPRWDSRREVAFIALFLAIQLGAGLAPLATEMARQRFGWSGSFATSAAGMALAVVLLLGRGRIPTPLQPATTAEPPPRWSALLLTYLIYSLYNVAASSLAIVMPLFTRDHTDLTLGGRFPSPISAGWLQASEGAFQILLAPMVILGLIYLRRRRLELSVLAKIGIGMVLMVVPHLLMVSAALAAADGQRVSILWVLGAYLASALPSLFLLPIVLALISQLLPGRHLSTAFSFWFALTAVSHKIAGMLGAGMSQLPLPMWYGGLGLIALLAAGLWISQVRRLGAALRPNQHSILET